MQRRPIFVYSDRRLARNIMFTSLIGFALALLASVFSVADSFLVLDFLFATCVLVSLVFLLNSPEYRFYSDGVRVNGGPFSGSLEIHYDRIQYCRAVYPASFFSSLIERGKSISLDRVEVLEIKPLSVQRKFLIRSNPVLPSLGTDLLHYVNERRREMEKSGTVAAGSA